MHIKSNNGASAFDFIMILLIVAVGSYYFLVLPYINQNVVQNLKSSAPPVTAEQKYIIDEYKEKPSPAHIPLGQYYASGEHDGKEYQLLVTFHKDNTITKSLTVMDEYVISGNASYVLNGSVLKYVDITGDKYLFSEIGSALTVNGKQITFHDPDGDNLVLSHKSLLDERKLQHQKEELMRKEALAAKPFTDLSVEEAVEKYLVSDQGISGILMALTIIIFLYIAFSGYAKIRDGWY